MTCDKLLWNKLLNRGMLTSEERNQEKEIKEVAEQMLHMQEGQKYNPIVAKMTETQLAEFLSMVFGMTSHPILLFRSLWVPWRCSISPICAVLVTNIARLQDPVYPCKSNARTKFQFNPCTCGRWTQRK